MQGKSRRRKAWLFAWGIILAVLTSVSVNRAVYLRKLQEQDRGKVARILSASLIADKRATLEKEYASLTELEGIEARRLFDSVDMDAYSFGILVNGMLFNNEVQITSTKMQESGGRPVLEYVLRAPTLSFFEFLKEVAEYEKRLETPYLSISVQENEVYAVMRITYAHS